MGCMQTSIGGRCSKAFGQPQNLGPESLAK